MSEELDPCPFCGNTQLEIGNLGEGDDWFVECEKNYVEKRGCGMSLHAIHPTREDAITAWNKRPQERVMRDRCFHDFVLMLERNSYVPANAAAQTAVKILAEAITKQGPDGLGDAPCECGKADCPYKAADTLSNKGQHASGAPANSPRSFARSSEMYMELKKRTIAGSDRAKVISTVLVGLSTWFVCEPMPDGQFGFTVKAEAVHVLERCIVVAQQTDAANPIVSLRSGKKVIHEIILEAIAAAYSTTTEAVENDLRECEGDEDIACLCEALARQGY